MHGEVQGSPDGTNCHEHDHQQHKNEPGCAASRCSGWLRDPEGVDEGRRKRFEKLHRNSVRKRCIPRMTSASYTYRLPSRLLLR